MALVGGRYAPPGRIMGHAGAWTAPGEPDAGAKYKALQSAGAVMVNHPEDFGEGMKSLFSTRARAQGATVSEQTREKLKSVNKLQSTNPANQKRGLHTMRRAVRRNTPHFLPQSQTRSLYVKQFQALDMLRQKSIRVNDVAPSGSDIHLSLTVDRTALTPCILASTNAEFIPSQTGRFPFPYSTAEFNAINPLIGTIASQLQLPETAHAGLAEVVQALWQIFKEKEAYLLEIRANPSTEGSLEVRGARFGFDDAAFRSSGRQEEVHRLRTTAEEVPEEVEAEKDGIVYVKYVPFLRINLTITRYLRISTQTRRRRQHRHPR